MKRFFLYLVLFVSLFLGTGCSSTHHMVSPAVLSKSMSLEEKFSSFGLEKIQVSYPTVYYDGVAWRNRIHQLVSEAKDYIILSSFLASSSEDLKDLYATIAEKAESGVRIYFIVDGMGPFDMTDTRYHLIPIKNLRDSGVHLLEYNPVSIARLVSVLHVFNRDHRKFLIVDGKTLAVGGMNLNYISIGAMGKNQQRDSMYEFESPQLCSIMLDAFVPWWNEQSWESICREDFLVDENSLAGKKTYDAWYINQGPQAATTSLAYGALLAEAEHSVKVLPFLPFMDENMIESFRLAKERGADVQMIIPFDKRVTNRKGIEYMTKDLLTMDIDLRIEKESEESQRLLHEKLMIVDDRYVVIGSANINYRSFNLSYENFLVIDSEEFALQLEKHFDSLYQETRPVTDAMADRWQTLENFPRFAFGFFGG